MSCHSKEVLENMLEDVINELDLSDAMFEKHGPLGTPANELVRYVLEEKDRRIALLKQKMIDVQCVTKLRAKANAYDEGKEMIQIVYCGIVCKHPSYTSQKVRICKDLP